MSQFILLAVLVLVVIGFYFFHRYNSFKDEKELRESDPIMFKDVKFEDIKFEDKFEDLYKLKIKPELVLTEAPSLSLPVSVTEIEISEVQLVSEVPPVSEVKSLYETKVKTPTVRKPRIKKVEEAAWPFPHDKPVEVVKSTPKLVSSTNIAIPSTKLKVLSPVVKTKKTTKKI